MLNPRDVNSFNFSYSTFFNDIEPVTPGPQLTFPSIQDGASFRVPQGTKQRRLQFSDTFSMVRGNHTLNFGGEIQRVDADFDLRVFQHGRIEMIEDFPDFDRNGDGRVDDNDLLFAVTLRSGKPTRAAADSRRRQHLLRRLCAGRLARSSPTDLESRFAL